METLLGFKLDFWDYATFLVLLVCVMTGLFFLVWLAGLPGRIAIARKHPDAEAVQIMGYAGFLVAVPWIQAFIWAFKPTDIVDSASPKRRIRGWYTVLPFQQRIRWAQKLTSGSCRGCHSRPPHHRGRAKPPC
jgi:hypothetical protein